MQAKLDLDMWILMNSVFHSWGNGNENPVFRSGFFYLQAPACVIHKKLNKQRKGGI